MSPLLHLQLAVPSFQPCLSSVSGLSWKALEINPNIRENRQFAYLQIMWATRAGVLSAMMEFTFKICSFTACQCQFERMIHFISNSQRGVLQTAYNKISGGVGGRAVVTVIFSNKALFYRVLRSCYCCSHAPEISSLLKWTPHPEHKCLWFSSRFCFKAHLSSMLNTVKGQSLLSVLCCSRHTLWARMGKASSTTCRLTSTQSPYHEDSI